MKSYNKNVRIEKIDYFKKAYYKMDDYELNTMITNKKEIRMIILYLYYCYVIMYNICTK